MNSYKTNRANSKRASQASRGGCGFEPLESRTLQSVTPIGLDTTIVRPIDPGILLPLNGGFTSFSVTDASRDGTSATAFAGGALRVSFAGNFASGSSVRLDVMRDGAVVTTRSYDAPAVSDALINLGSFPALGPGNYEVRGVGTGWLGGEVVSATQAVQVLPVTTVSGTFGGETLNYWGGPGTGTVVYGLGGSDTLSLHGIRPSMVASLDRLPLGWFNPTSSASNNAIYRGTAFDHLVTVDGKEIYFQGVEKLRFTDGTELSLAVRPNDPSFADQWNLHVTDVDGAWRFTKGGGGVLIASLDTGVLTASGATGGIFDLSAARRVTDSTDDDNYNNYGHGHCSISVMSSTANNGDKVAGINWVSDVYVNDVYSGVNLQAAITDSINYARAHNQKVVFQGGIQGEGWLTSGGSQAALESLITANSDVAFFAVAAGNGGPGGNLTDPNHLTSVSGVAKLQTAHANVMSVGALKMTGSNTVNGLTNASTVGLAGYSNRGGNLTMVAPTDSPAADKTGSVRTFGGTSCANPNMAGIASLVWAAHPGMNGEELRNVLTSTAMDLGAAGRDNTFGRGLVNADAAVRRAWALERDGALADLNTFRITLPIRDYFINPLLVKPVIGPDPIEMPVLSKVVLPRMMLASEGSTAFAGGTALTAAAGKQTSASADVLTGKVAAPSLFA